MKRNTEKEQRRAAEEEADRRKWNGSTFSVIVQALPAPEKSPTAFSNLSVVIQIEKAMGTSDRDARDALEFPMIVPALTREKAEKLTKNLENLGVDFELVTEPGR